ncbi:hypothetical protein ACFQZI_12675 [Mucilaginibacter lutimaris]|uniref:Uncharacterized protein n=1 Tax=Mucilaginibacter lutimaris TaxID=931629 RepID=A0ABW2ZHT4_9SPHI
MKHGSIIVNISRSEWGQFIDKQDDNHSIFFNGENYISIDNGDIDELNLPSSLSALGFTEVTPQGAWPKEYQNRNGLLIIERAIGEFYIDDKPVKFASEVQEQFDLYNLLNKPDDADRFL